MYKEHTIGVVVPAYNEEDHVGEVIETLPAFVDRAYVVDDRSTDGTWQEIRRHARLCNVDARRAADGAGQSLSGQAVSESDAGIHPRIIPIRHEQNRGVGAAIKTGYRRAKADGLDVAAVMAGDGQMDPDILDRILDPVVEGTADYAKGNRLQYRKNWAEMSAWRFFGNTLLTALTKIASGYWRMMDPQNGYTAIALDVFDGVDIDRLHDDYGFCNDLLVRCNVHGVRVTDVPMPARYDDEESDIAYSQFVPQLSWLLLRDFLWRLKAKYVVLDFHPLVFMYGLGTVGWSLGCLGLGVAVLDSDLGTVAGLLAVLILLVGGLFLTLAMAYDRHANADLEPASEWRDRP